jgi:hypothetical protein
MIVQAQRDNLIAAALDVMRKDVEDTQIALQEALNAGEAPEPAG